jgi:hypothetical protein
MAITTPNHTRIKCKPFEVEACLIIFKNSVLTSNKTQHASITKISCLMLFREIIAKNNTKPINNLCGQNAELLNVEVGGT